MVKISYSHWKIIPVGRVVAKVDEMWVALDSLSVEAHQLLAAVAWFVVSRVYPRSLRMDGEVAVEVTRSLQIDYLSDSTPLENSHHCNQLSFPDLLPLVE